MVKLLVIISNEEKKIKNLLKKYKLTFTAMTYGIGTASSSLLKYFGLDEIKRNIYFTLISSDLEKAIMKELYEKIKLTKVGEGIAFTISLTSSSKFLKDSLVKKDVEQSKMETDYELIVTIVKEGYSDLVMQAAKSVGCNGGTLIEGRSLGSERTIFMNLSIEPEKDIVLNIVKSDIKRKVMESITEKAGVKTSARGLVFSLPIDTVVGLQEENLKLL